MKYLVKKMIIFLLIFVLLKQIMFTFYQKHNINYNIGNFNIREIFESKNNNYYFEIKSDDIKINFQINKNYNKNKKIINKLIYKNIDGYKCIMPIFKNNEIITDIMCLKDNEIHYAHNLNNENIEKEFQKYAYNSEKYIDKAKKIEISNSQSIYKDNISKDTYIAVETYKGLKLFNGKETEVKLFENDIYKKPISIFANKYYIVADYNTEYNFKNFYVVNIINGEKIKIRSYDDISFDSYIMGYLNNKVYIFDKETNKQYEVDIKTESVNQIGDKNNIKYYNGKWKTITLQEAKEEKKFTTSKTVKGYQLVEKINNNYYFYKTENDITKVYRADKNNKNLKTYLFETTDINNITYLNDKIYYKNKTNYNMYSINGERKLISDKELEFNNDISFGVYQK